ncbi:MAG: DNA repair protein RecN [Holophagaceae bacterium]|nr:DNA repair protein RecN [Holophagaceae bacterium]
MLSSLRIKNLALVEDLSLDLASGFTVLTGETGAGKSLLVDALALLVGARGDADTVRREADRAMVEGVVEENGAEWLKFLNEHGLPEEHPVVLRREVNAAGRSRAWINGAPCSLADMKEAGRIWMRLTSQHDHQSLLGEDRHLALLDEVLGIEAKLEAEATAVREAEGALKARKRSEADRARRLEQLAEQLAELQNLAPRPGEWAQLRADREPLRHGVQLEAAFREAADSLRIVIPEAETASRAVARAAMVMPAAQDQLDRLRSLLLELEDLQALAQDQAIHFAERGADALDALETRLAAFEKQARRHHCEPEELAKKTEELREEQRQLLGGEASIAELEVALKRVAEAYRLKAEALHQRRADALAKLESEVHRRLAQLGMKGARIQVRLSLAEDSGSPVIHQGIAVRVAPSGFSGVAFWIESNPGEGFRPLAKIASGGELSRLMLSLLGAGIALRKGNGAPALTLVLDEVDAGIGGETALEVGAAIQALGVRHQVLAVTHLAQVASRADHHGLLSKSTEDGRTRSELSWVDGDLKLRELARLLSGHPDRPEALEHARVLVSD